MKTVETVNIPSGQPEQLGDPCIMVIFGASGDLTKRKLIPALYSLARENYLPREFAVVGIARSGMSNEEFRDKITQDMKSLYPNDLGGGAWEEFAKRLHYLPGSGTADRTYIELKELLGRIDGEYRT